jgi:hypothetical protein
MTRALALILMAGSLAACSQSGSGDNGAAAPAPGASTSIGNLATPPSRPQNTDDPLLFIPLQSQPVKDAIHGALVTGQTQRWQDGKLSGYAVPSQSTGANGCRAVRYTVDQRPSGNFESITACSASR